MGMRRLLTLMAASLISACAANPAPVPVVGDEVSVATLAGRWEGSYSSTETGRSGSIIFTLTAGEDTAHGDVLMVPAAQEEPPDPERPGAMPFGPRTQVLTIAFVQVGGARVVGQLDPYRDPECGCELTTTFEGRVEGDVIDGTFVTRHAHEGVVREGRWRVTRKPDPARTAH